MSANFDYHLPKESIALTPADNREEARLLQIDRLSGGRTDHVFSDLTNLLRPGDLLVLNDTKVFPARVFAKRASSGGRVEILFMHPQDARHWMVLTRSGGKLKVGEELLLPPAGTRLQVAERRGMDGDLLHLPDGFNVAAYLAEHGAVPLPPYIDREAGPEDRARYQTVYARETGSVAAPTAGLHFTTALLDRLAAKDIQHTRITLHVGPGTFRPVKAEQITDHRITLERFEITAEAAEDINRARREKRRIIAVGTTVVRTLEYQAGDCITPGTGWTDMFIYPPYTFRFVDGLITNFHLPRSTLLMLVCALAGRENILAAYAHAQKSGYRFYSYGDAMIID